MPRQKRHQREVQEILEKGLIGEVAFAGPTYQVQVFEPERASDHWVFVQLGPKGDLKDAFCDCSEEACVHVAAAYEAIFRGEKKPLHLRFQHSLWNCLGQLFSDRLGDNTAVLENVAIGEYRCDDFFAKGEGLDAIFENRTVETEETSLKFSNLSQEDIHRWKEGRPTAEIQYLLSFWYDLAVELMRLQESHAPYTISFKYDKQGLPHFLTVTFPNLEVGFSILVENLPVVVPALASVVSPLKVYKSTQIRARYFEEEGALEIDLKGPKEKEIKGISLPGFVFVPKDGFYPVGEGDLPVHGRFKGEELTEILDLYSDRLVLKGLHLDPMTPSYKLAFDSAWNLQITSYLFNVGDISNLFGNWAHLKGDGFYKLENVLLEKAVPEKEMNAFVTEHRSFLAAQEGFHPHLVNLEHRLSYEVDKDGRLSFQSLIETGEDAHDFGNWIYVTGEGFYSKTVSGSILPNYVGQVIRPDELPAFVRFRREELQMIPRFFTERNPVKRVALDIKLEKKGSISLTPHYELLPGHKNVKFYEEFVYLPGEGFCTLPPKMRLPEAFQTPHTIPADEFDSFIDTFLGPLSEYGGEVDPRLRAPASLRLVAKTAAELVYVSVNGEVDATLLGKALTKKKKYLATPAGLIDLRSERFFWLRGVHKKLSTLDLLRIDAFDQVETTPETEQLFRELREFHIPVEPDHSGLTSTLRPYQVMGLRWLWFLYQHQLSGLLCDDMGLGKTHQAMALFAAIKKGHFLVVCPTSVLYHWEEKLKNFLPSLRVCTYHGVERSLADFHAEYDILLTSYGIWRNDHKLLEGTSFEVAVFDEIQVAKNHSSLVYHALQKVDARMKLGLTGTPIENRIRELKALFDIVLPHYMPGEKEYQELFVKPIERDDNRVRKTLLKRFIRPFVLRRMKGEVLDDLPEKVEEVVHSALLPEQQKLYQELLQKSRTSIIQQLQDPNTNVPYIHVFALLSGLKQICNHPAVFLKDALHYKKYQSGKWDLFLELLEEARASNQKVVVFSQYLTMIDIIEAHLQEHKIAYATIRGATVNRAEEVRRFNQDPTCEVFVGSLFASGLGIDLTAASVVIHYDRAWTAARENQATDRVHRIGQTKNVQVFKLMAKNTFEERIDRLIAWKGKLMEDVVAADESQLLKQFTRTEILDLLQDVTIPAEEKIVDSL